MFKALGKSKIPTETDCAVMWSLTIDIETAVVQGVVAQLGDAMGFLTQLPVQLLSVQPRACSVRAEGTDDAYSCGCSTFLTPGKGRTGGHRKGVLSFLGVPSKRTERRKPKEMQR